MSSFLIVLGAACCLIGSIGVYRLNGLLPKVHAASISSSLGLPLMLIAAGIHLGDLSAFLKAGSVIVLLYLSAPVVGHLLGLIGRDRIKH